MKIALQYTKDPRVTRIVELAAILRDRLQYPNSENSRDERHYTEWFEEEVLKLINQNGVVQKQHEG
jgi:hypothetical protein